MKVVQSIYKPFVLVTEKNQEKKKIVRIAVGNQIACPINFKTEKEANTYLLKQPYEMFINLYSILRHYENENKKQNQKNVEKNS